MQLKRVAVELQNKLKAAQKERDIVKKKEKKPDLKLLNSLSDLIMEVDTLKTTINDADENLLEPVKLFKDQLQIEYTPRVKILL